MTPTNADDSCRTRACVLSREIRRQPSITTIQISLTVLALLGVRKMVVIETNSSPSGQKSMPFIAEHEEQNGYRIMMENSAKPAIEARTTKSDGIAPPTTYPSPSGANY
jgi:hypothetical protein